MLKHADMVTDTECIEQLMSLGLWQGAEEHFAWRYAEWLGDAGFDKADILAQWFTDRKRAYRDANPGLKI